MEKYSNFMLNVSIIYILLFRNIINADTKIAKKHISGSFSLKP